MKYHLIVNIIITVVVTIVFIWNSIILSKRQPYTEKGWNILEAIWVFGGFLVGISWFILVIDFLTET